MADIYTAIRGRRMPANAAIAELASRQHGVVATWQLLRTGLSHGAIQRRVENGLLHRLHRGVFGVGFRNPTPKARLAAARLAIGERAAVAQFGAAHIHGFAQLLAGRPVDIVAMRGNARPGRRDGIVLHHTRSLPQEDLAVREGIWCTSVARTLIDLAGRCTERHLTRLYEEADRAGLIDPGAVSAALRRARGRPGVGRLRRLHGSHSLPAPHTESHAEHRFFRVWERTGGPMPEVNALVAGHRVDLLWRDLRFVVELDGPSFHDRRGQGERDRVRGVELSLARHVVHRFGTDRVYDDEEGLIREIVRLQELREQELRGGA